MAANPERDEESGGAGRVIQLPVRLQSAIDRCLRDSGDKDDLTFPLPAVLRTKTAKDAFRDTFDLIGGIPRLAHWANDPANYATFIKLFAKQMTLPAAGTQDDPLVVEIKGLAGRFGRTVEGETVPEPSTKNDNQLSLAL